jgi:hypothetical protein
MIEMPCSTAIRKGPLAKATKPETLPKQLRCQSLALDDFQGAFGGGVQEGLPVSFGQYPVVQHHNDPLIGFGPDQAPDALAEFATAI